MTKTKFAVIAHISDNHFCRFNFFTTFENGQVMNATFNRLLPRRIVLIKRQGHWYPSPFTDTNTMRVLMEQAGMIAEQAYASEEDFNKVLAHAIRGGVQVKILGNDS